MTLEFRDTKTLAWFLVHPIVSPLKAEPINQETEAKSLRLLSSKARVNGHIQCKNYYQK